MPGPEFFNHTGLFVRRGFFCPSECLEIQGNMAVGEFEKGLVAKHEVEDGVLDESVRAVLAIRVPKPLRNSVRDKLWDLKSDFENHFGVKINVASAPVFLRYEVGSFYRPHSDTSPDARPDILARKVSIVVFLNSASLTPQENCFGGGSLSFYGLFKEPEWEKCAFELEPEAGLLIAFPSDMLHEVHPVTFGQRFTIVSWFTS